METIHFIISFIFGFFIFFLSTLIFNSHFYSYKKKKIKNDILITEKSASTLLCFIFYMIICLYNFLNENNGDYTVENKLSKIQLIIFNIFISMFFSFRLFMSFEFYLTYKRPNYIFNSIIYNYKSYLRYEIILFIITLSSNVFFLFSEDIYTEKKQYKDIPFFLFDKYKWIIFLLFSFISLSLYLKTMNLVRSLSFKTKNKFIKICKKNIFLSLIYLIFSILHGITISLYEINNINTKYLIIYHHISSYSSLILILIDQSIELYYLSISKFCQYKLRKTLVYFIRQFFQKDNTIISGNKNLPDNSIINDVSDFSYETSNLSENLIAFAGDEELIECYKNGYIFEDYFFDYYEEILNISLVSIFNIYQTSQFSQRAQSRNLREAFNISNTLSMSKSKTSGKFSLSQIAPNKYVFKKNDFEEYNGFLFNKNKIINDPYFDIKVTASVFHVPNIIEVLNFRNLNVEFITNSLLSHLNNKIKDDYFFQSLICSNVQEEYFNSLKNLSIKTKDKEFQIDIFQTESISIDLDSILENYYVYISNTTNTFLPILLGTFIIKINNFSSMLFLISRNSLVENIQKDTFSFWQLVRFEEKKVSSLTSSQSLNKSYIVKNDPIFERNYEIETKLDDENINKIHLKNYFDFFDILKNDLDCLKKMKLKKFHLLMMYYEYENTQKHESKGKLVIKKKGSNEAEIINIGSHKSLSPLHFSLSLNNEDLISNNNEKPDNNILELGNNINICSYDGTFHHFNCLCYFMFQNLFEIKKNNLLSKVYDNFYNNLKNYFSEFVQIKNDV